MNRKQLAKVLREHGETILARENRTPEDNDSAEICRVAARLVEGTSVAKAFGAPGDWGYGTPIGDALAAPEGEAS